MSRVADRVVVVADATKIGLDKLQATVPFEAIHTFVTDEAAPLRSFIDMLRSRGVEVIVPSAERSAEPQSCEGGGIMYNPNWSHVDVNSVPHMVTASPGPRSQEMHARTAKYMKGLSSQVQLVPGRVRSAATAAP